MNVTKAKDPLVHFNQKIFYPILCESVKEICDQPKIFLIHDWGATARPVVSSHYQLKKFLPLLFALEKVSSLNFFKQAESISRHGNLKLIQ